MVLPWCKSKAITAEYNASMVTVNTSLPYQGLNPTRKGDKRVWETKLRPKKYCCVFFVVTPLPPEQSHNEAIMSFH